MNRISNAVKCKNCFSLLKNPVLLPCKHAICKHHVDDGSSTNPCRESIMCFTCDALHKIPPEGFLEISALNEMIEAEIDRISLGPIHERSKKSCSDLESVFAGLDSLLRDPANFTNEEIGKLKNAVQIKSEQLKLKIDEETDKLMKKFDDYQKMCNQQLSNNDYKEGYKVLKELKNAEERKLTEWKASLDKIKFDEDEWMRIKIDCEILSKSLTEKMDVFKKSLLLDQLEDYSQLVDRFRNTRIVTKSEPFKPKIVDTSITNTWDEFLKKRKASKFVFETNSKGPIIFGGEAQSNTKTTIFGNI